MSMEWQPQSSSGNNNNAIVLSPNEPDHATPANNDNGTNRGSNARQPLAQAAGGGLGGGALLISRFISSNSAST